MVYGHGDRQVWSIWRSLQGVCVWQTCQWSLLGTVVRRDKFPFSPGLLDLFVGKVTCAFLFSYKIPEFLINSAGNTDEKQDMTWKAAITRLHWTDYVAGKQYATYKPI